MLTRPLVRMSVRPSDLLSVRPVVYSVVMATEQPTRFKTHEEERTKAVHKDHFILREGREGKRASYLRCKRQPRRILYSMRQIEETEGEKKDRKLDRPIDRSLRNSVILKAIVAVAVLQSQLSLNFLQQKKSF